MSDEHRLLVHTPHELRSIALQSRDFAQDLSEVLRRSGLPLNTRCGRRQLCNGCFVEVKVGELASVRDREPNATRQSGPVRACQYRLIPGDEVEIEIPARSLLAHAPQIVASFRCNISHAFDPLWQRIRWTDWPPQLEDATTETICRALAEHCSRDVPVVPDISISDLQPADLATGSIVFEYRGDSWFVSRRSQRDGSEYALAVDIGTTTVVAMLVDLNTGGVGAIASALNGQVALGDNVVTRINLCTQDKSHVSELQDAVVRTISQLIDQVSEEAGIASDQLVAISMAGNTTMLHLLAGVDPSSMGVAPFTPQFVEYRRLPLRGLPFPDRVGSHSETIVDAKRSACQRHFTSEAAAHLLPSVGAYVGADITAGVFASGMVYRSEPCLLVDIGTNGEIVLNHEGRFVACATAAGPAFEGAGMSCGVRAGTGAISHVRLEGDPPAAQVEVIGDVAPIGFCGTGYVDAVAQARRANLIGRTGRMTPEGLRCPLFQALPKGRGFKLAQSRGGEPLVVSEADIASLLQAKAAIAAGILCLLARFNLKSNDIATVYLAGGFGFHMDLPSLIGCGILPGFETSQIEVVGNTSLAGAFLALLDVGAIDEMRRVARETEIVELNLEPNFTSCYIDQLFLP